jgi:hypothetical protein
MMQASSYDRSMDRLVFGPRGGEPAQKDPSYKGRAVAYSSVDEDRTRTDGRSDPNEQKRTIEPECGRNISHRSTTC